MGNSAQLEIILDRNGAIRGWKDFSAEASKGKDAVLGVEQALNKQADAADKAGLKAEAGQKKAVTAASAAKKAVDDHTTALKAATAAQDAQITKLEEGANRVAKAQARMNSSFTNTQAPRGRMVSNSSGSGFGEAGDIEKQLKQADQAAQKFRQSGTKAMDEVHHHALQPIDSLRQVRDLFGIQITGSMEKVIAASPAMMNGLMAISKVAVFGGYAMIGIETAKGLYEGYKAVSTLNDGMVEYRKEAEKSQRAEIVDNASLEQSIRLVKELTQSTSSFEQKARKVGYDPDTDRGSIKQHVKQWSVEAGNSALAETGQVGVDVPDIVNEADLSKYVQNLADIEKSQQRIRQLQREIALQNKQGELDLSVAGLEGPAQLAAQAKADQELANFKAGQQVQENKARFDDRNATLAKLRKVPGVQENQLPETLTLDPKAGETQRQQDLLDAQREGLARRRAMALQAHDEVIGIEHVAQTASLRGEAVYQKQAEQQYEDFTRKYGANAAARAAIDRRYQAERKQRLEQETMTSNQTSRAAEIAGMQGVGRTQAQLQVDLKKIDDDEKAGRYVSADNAEKDRNSARVRAAADVAQQVKQFNRDIDESFTQSTTSTLEGFARIEADAAETTKRMRQHFDDLWDDAKRGTAEYAEALKKELAAEDAARQDAARKQARLNRDNADETLSIEAEAHRRSLPVWQQAQQEILDDYAERRRKLDEMLHDAQIGEADYQRRVIAMDREKNAELQQNARDTRDRIASTLQGFISDPMQALRQQAERAMATSAADMVMRFGNKIPGVSGKGMPGGTPGMESLPWMRGFGGGNMIVPFGGAHAPAGAANGALQMQTATIQIGTATIMGGGGGAGASMMPMQALPSSVGSMMSSSAYSMADFGGMTKNLTTGASVFTPFADKGDSLLSAMPSSVSSLSPTDILQHAQNSTEQMQTVTSDTSRMWVGQDNESDTPDGSNWDKGGGLLGAGQAGLGLWGAYQNKSLLGGMFGGAMSGAKLGMQLGGPWGAAIGAAAGIALSFMGDHGRSQAKQYDEKTVKPWIADEFRTYERGGGDYLTLYSDIDAFSASSKKQTDGWGTGAQSYYTDTIKPELAAAQAKLTRLQKAGRSKFQFTAAQYHSGDLINSFGDFRTSPTEGMINAEIGEFMVRSQPARAHLPTLRAINSGVSPEDLAKSYQSSIDADQRQRMMQTITNNSHQTIQALDSESFERFARRNAGTLRAVTNSSLGDSAGFGY